MGGIADVGVVRVTIEYNPSTGALQVRAPQDSLLAFGMLEAAKVVITRRAEQAQKSRIVVPQ